MCKFLCACLEQSVHVLFVGFQKVSLSALERLYWLLEIPWKRVTVIVLSCWVMEIIVRAFATAVY